MKAKILTCFLAIVLITSCTKDSTQELDDQNTIVGTSFLAGPDGNPIGGGDNQDCSSYIPRRISSVLSSSCSFQVYYNNNLTQNQIACVRKEYFENNPGLHLYTGPRPLSILPNQEWWIFGNNNCGGPTHGSTPKNGAGEDADTDTRVCIRRPCN